MGKFSFRNLEEEERKRVLPLLFRILYENMSKIAPSETGFAEDERAWMGYLVPALDSGVVQVLLIYAGETLAGYFQYSVAGDTLLVEEVEIKPEYQRTFLFYRFCQYLRSVLPEVIQYVSSYVNKGNLNSIAIHEKLGMVRMGENGKGTSWLYRGERKKMEEKFR